MTDFIEAGIKVWIVTGDKDTTAQAIGYESGILDESRKLIKLSEIKGKKLDSR